MKICIKIPLRKERDDVKEWQRNIMETAPA